MNPHVVLLNENGQGRRFRCPRDNIEASLSRFLIGVDIYILICIILMALLGPVRGHRTGADDVICTFQGEPGLKGVNDAVVHTAL